MVDLRVSHADLLPGKSVLVDVPQFEASGGVVERVDRGFLVQVSKDPDVQNWLISVSERDNTRGDYLEHLARFLAWAGWMPSKIWELKREALKLGEPQSQVEVQIRRYHEALRKMEYAGKTRAKHVAAIYSFIASKGYHVPRKLVRLDMADKYMMRVPERTRK